MEFCSIASGSSGNCTYVGTDHASILVDAGISAKRIILGLQEIDRRMEEIDAILVTHEHIDHIRGLGVLSRKYSIPMYMTAGTMQYIRSYASLGMMDYSLMHKIQEDQMFSIKDLKILPFRISHDAAQPVGYRFECGSAAAAVATDMGCWNQYTVDHLKNLNGILLESNHDVNMLETGPYPYPLKRRILGDHGHLSNENAGKLLCRILNDDMKGILLGHLSKENNIPELAYITVTGEITMGDNPYHSDDFRVEVAARDHRSPVITL